MNGQCGKSSQWKFGITSLMWSQARQVYSQAATMIKSSPKTPGGQWNWKDRCQRETIGCIPFKRTQHFCSPSWRAFLGGLISVCWKGHTHCKKGMTHSWPYFVDIILAGTIYNMCEVFTDTFYGVNHYRDISIACGSQSCVQRLPSNKRLSIL